MQTLAGKTGYEILLIGSFVAVIAIIYWLDYSGWMFRVQKWLWGTVSLIGAAISLGFMVGTIDFSKPLLLSVYWSTVGYFILAVTLLLLGLDVYAPEMKTEIYVRMNVPELEIAVH